MRGSTSTWAAANVHAQSLTLPALLDTEHENDSEGLLLTIAGLYGLVAYNVSRRTREIGIRIAIGARPRDVLRLAMGRGLVLVGIGTGIGLAMGSAVEHLFNSMIFNAGGVDLVVYVAVVPSLLLVTILAAYMPARRASRIAPTQALRYE